MNIRYFLKMLEKLGLAFEKWARENMPDPFVLVLLLTVVTLCAAAFVQPTHIGLIPHDWFNGFWQLLSFTMQMVLIIVTGEAIVETKPVQIFFKWFCNQPKSATAALWMLSSFALALGWIHWGFGLIGAALLARQMASELEKKQVRVDYPLLGASAYLAMLLWHAGTTATAPLLINTPGHFLEKQIGLVPLNETVFLPMNLMACLILWIVTPWIVVKMHRKDPRSSIEYLSHLESTRSSHLQNRSPSKSNLTRAERIDQNPYLGKLLGAIGVLTLGVEWFGPTGRFNLTHNVVNFLLLSVGLILHRSPVTYAQAISRSIRGTAGMVIQYPFYGGIMGIIEGSGLGHAIADRFLAFATMQTLPLIAYLTATLTKLFVPSGGGEWALEGPIMLQAAKTLGASLGKTTMGIAYGNMVGNLFQPFWAVPLLAILGLKARDIMGYCLVIFLFAFPILGIALAIF